MQIKRRGKRAVLVESRYVRKGSEGNSHGFTRQRQVCSFDVDAVTIPPEVDAVLTVQQRKVLMDRVVTPAQRRAAQKRADDAARAIDGGWRLSEALRLVNEAAALSQTNAVASKHVQELDEAIRKVVANGGGRSVGRDAAEDPIAAAMTAIRSATKAVESGYYGLAPSSGVRETKAYQRWNEVQRALIGDDAGSLMRALQRAGFVKTKG